MADFTKGPWRWDTTSFDTRSGESAPTLMAENTGILSCDGPGNAPTKGDALFIAAAPDMYAALDEALSVDGHVRGGHCTTTGCDPLCETIRAALAKADGK